MEAIIQCFAGASFMKRISHPDCVRARTRLQSPTTQQASTGLLGGGIVEALTKCFEGVSFMKLISQPDCVRACTRPLPKLRGRKRPGFREEGLWKP